MRRIVTVTVVISVVVLLSVLGKAFADGPKSVVPDFSVITDTLDPPRPSYDITPFEDPYGILNNSSPIQSGDIINRPNDGVTQIESGDYLVPNNRVYVDSDSNGVLDPEPQFARIVIVMRDNLTYLFEKDSSKVMGVFPNGIGKGGANSIVSVRRINVILGPDWGLTESIRENLIPYPDGTIPNYFGDATLGTRFYVNSDPANDIDTFQEVHGTFRAHAGSVDGYSLLGTDISGGCVRHTNEAIVYMSHEVQIGDLVVTVETPEDDIIDNPFTIYNRTMLAAGKPIVSVDYNTVSTATFFHKPENYHPPVIDVTTITKPTWVPFESLPYPIIYTPVEHPYTRGDYVDTPCGMETLYISEILNGRNPLNEENGTYSLKVAPIIEGPSGEQIETSQFYKPPLVTIDTVVPYLSYFSGGDIHVSIFEYLVADFTVQYGHFFYKSFLDPWDLRRTQLVTGLLPTEIKVSRPNEILDTLTNRALVHRIMNILYGAPGEVYELDPREPVDADAFRLFDNDMGVPSFDHDLTRTKDPGAAIYPLIENALANGEDTIFRISNYRYLADASFFLGMSAAHYYALIPEYSDIPHGIFAIQDSMHPYDVLFVPVDSLAALFTTVTISPHS